MFSTYKELIQALLQQYNLVMTALLREYKGSSVD